jgi:hypothetical protein
MSAVSSFEACHGYYEAWFIRCKTACWDELLALRALIGLYRSVQEF